MDAVTGLALGSEMALLPQLFNLRRQRQINLGVHLQIPDNPFVLSLLEVHGKQQQGAEHTQGSFVWQLLEESLTGY